MQVLKEMQQEGQVDGEAGQKVAFPEGSSGSMPASVAGREVMPGTGRGDWDRDMDSMLVFLDESLKTSADSRANPAGETDLASQPTFRNEPLGGSEGVSAGRTFPGPLVDVARRPSSLGRGLLRLENKLRGESKFLEASKHMEKMLSDLERRQEVDGDAGQKAAFPEGSSGSMTASAVGLEAMPGTSTGGWDKDMDYLENLLDYGLRFMGNPGAGPAGEGGAASQPTSRTESLGDAEVMDQTSVQKEAHPGGSISPWAAPAAGRKAKPDTGTGTADAAGTTTRVPDAQKGLGRVFYMGTGCWAGVMAGLLLLHLILILCCVKIWCYWKKKWSTSGASPAKYLSHGELGLSSCISVPVSIVPSTGVLPACSWKYATTTA
ncbi:uncharacterized protein LOC135298372 isoform X2 [Passer domesticus]